MMKLVYFDICSIPIYLLILWTCHARKLTKSRAEKLFLLINTLSLVCAILDIVMEFVVNPTPLSTTEVVLGTAISFTYKILHNATLVLYLIFIFVITRTIHRLRSRKAQLLFWLPFIILTVILIQNFFTHNVFSVTAESGYSRGPLIIAVYAVAVLYGIAGFVYCIFCKRYLGTGKWLALLSIYVLIFIAMIIEFLIPTLLLEMFAITIGSLLVLNLVMRPEETMDGEVFVKSRRVYETDLRNALRSSDNIQIVVIQLINATEIRSYLGEKRYYSCVNVIVDELRLLCGKAKINMEMYFERPGTIFLMLDNPDYDVSSVVTEFSNSVRSRIKDLKEMGVQFESQICTIRCPEEMNDFREIIELGHKFPLLEGGDQDIYSASELMQNPNFVTIIHMEDILNRAISEDSLKIFYQPIYNVKTKHYDSAEALSRLIDSEYGMISPILFIPAAESNGLILLIGEKILESVYRFISEHDLNELGLSYIEINLSIAQMLQPDLPEILNRLQKKYHVKPEQINFEITESLFENISNVIVQNVQMLTEAGYSFSLDDYGTGYSSIQRMNKFPLSIVKLDKSLADDILTDNGSVIMLNTIRMMHDIHKELVVEGVETETVSAILEDMSCDYIQGYLYSRPLPEEELVGEYESFSVNTN
ncbi:MAG: EAL domain-containing protein [Parasporobacterium sp.]|nr:EAL domain-containing protein [Parasporobacterium sp.]